MNLRNLPCTILLAGAFAAASLCHAEETTGHIAFSDPSKPGILKIRTWRGDITVRGADVNEVTVRSESVDAIPTPRSDGMRVLSSTSAYGLSERNNTVSLEYGPGEGGGSADFSITVPRSTTVIVSNAASGSLRVADVSGDIDVRTLKGDVDLEDISGGALVETMKGDITVTSRALSASKPLSFTSMKGTVTIRVPADSKANVTLRTHRGVILTNFDDKALVTKSEIAPSSGRSPDAPPATPSVKSPDAPPAQPAKASADAPPQAKAADGWSKERDGSSDSQDEDWRGNVREAVREAAEAAREAADQAAIAVHEGLSDVRIEFSKDGISVPPMTGGKVVTGTLNGGGVEIQAASLMGDIILKKAD